MKAIRIVIILNFFFGIVYSQSFDVLKNYQPGNKLVYNYSYSDFDDYWVRDSTYILRSFDGKQIVSIDSVVNFSSNIVKYYFTIEKSGREVEWTTADTLSDKDTVQFSKYVICENKNINEDGADGYIFGWIFRDTLGESTEATWDPIINYPYSRLYKTYTDNSGLFYIRDDTMSIQYRPIAVNYYDSYYIETYLIDKINGLSGYAKTYSYYQTGFWEKLTLDHISSINIHRALPEQFYLYQNYPNPFNPSTKIKFTFNKGANVKLVVYDVLGKEVKKMLDGYKDAGMYEVEFNGSNLSSGVYFYQLQHDGNVINRKMVLLK